MILASNVNIVIVYGWGTFFNAFFMTFHMFFNKSSYFEWFDYSKKL